MLKNIFNKIKSTSLVLFGILGFSGIAAAEPFSFVQAATDASNVINSLLPGVSLIGASLIAIAVAIGGFKIIKNMAKAV